LDVVVPGTDDRAEVDRVIFDELTQGLVTPTSRERYLRVVADLAACGAQAVVLGCTEIEMLVSADDVAIGVLDSMTVHAEAAADLVLARRPLRRGPSPPARRLRRASQRRHLPRRAVRR